MISRIIESCAVSVLEVAEEREREELGEEFDEDGEARVGVGDEEHDVVWRDVELVG
jgi:hypothetical protein